VYFTICGTIGANVIFRFSSIGMHGVIPPFVGVAVNVRSGLLTHIVLWLAVYTYRGHYIWVNSHISFCVLVAVVGLAQGKFESLLPTPIYRITESIIAICCAVTAYVVTIFLPRLVLQGVLPPFVWSGSKCVGWFLHISCCWLGVYTHRGHLHLG